MQKRLLPLLFLLLSQQAYSETTVSNEDTDNSQAESAAATTKDDTQTDNNLSDDTQTESSDAPETSDDSALYFEQPATDNNSNTSTSITEASEASENQATTKSEATPENKSNVDEDGVDEELIAELLEEDEDGNEKNDEPVEPKKIKVKEDSEPPSTSSWLPEIEFGYRSEQGNEDERSLNARLALDYISGRLRNSGEVKIYMKNEDGEEDDRKQSYQLQSDYKISPKMYIYGSFKGIDSKYSSYFHDYTFSTGLGYQVTNTDTLTIETELGPGYRYQEPNTDEIDDDDPIFPENVDEPIIRANLTAKWKPFDSTSFNFDGTVVSGSSNTRIDTEISIINNITDDVALKISQSRQHLSRVPNNLSKTDSTITINILYSPK